MYKTKKINDKLYLFKGEDQIGEISPNALSYVKKGQEFGEDDLQLTYNRSTFVKFHIPKGGLPNHWYIAIKGPCGHFH